MLKQKIITLCFIACAIFTAKSQIVLSAKDSTTNIDLKEDFEDFSQVFGEVNSHYLSASHEYINAIFYTISSESISSASEMIFSHELFVLKDGTVKLLKFGLTGKDLQMTAEQETNIKKKLTQYIQEHEFPLEAKSNWHEFGMITIPQLEKMRFYKDYVKPNPKPTASEDTKLGIIQRLGNVCTEIWQNEGARNPTELKFNGLINVCLFKLDDDNPLFTKLKKLCPTESSDSLYGQIYDYIYFNCPIYKAKYGFYQSYPDYEKFTVGYCDCLNQEFEKAEGSISDRLYDADDICKQRAFNKELESQIIAHRDSIFNDARKNNLNSKVASDIYLSGFDGCTSFRCSLTHQIWRKGFVDAMKRDSMIDVYWSNKRQNLSMLPINLLYDEQLDDLEKVFRSKSDFDNNKNELERIAKELKKANDIKPGLIGQRRIKGAYVEEIVIFNNNFTDAFFEVQMHYDKKDATDKLIKIEYIPKNKVDLSRRTFNNAKNKITN